MMRICFALYMIGLLLFPLIALKLFGVIPCNWAVALAPLWVPNAVAIPTLLAFAIVEDYRSWNPHK